MNELETKLVAALRSGDYKQIKGRLHDGKGYCCLGVACVVAGLEPERDGKGYWRFDGLYERLPHHVADAFGWTPFGELKDGVDSGGTGLFHSLFGMNDSGVCFDAIADQIESGNVAKVAP